MERYLKEALADGTAIDAYKEPEVLRAYLEEKVGWLRTKMNIVDETVNEYIQYAREKGVVFYGDVDSWCSYLIVFNLKEILTTPTEKEIT